MIFINRKDLSNSAKRIKKHIKKEYKGVDLTYNQILNIIVQNNGYKDYQNYLDSDNYTYESMNHIKQKENELINHFKKEYNVILSPQLICIYQDLIKEQIVEFYENIYSYNLVEYINIYNIITNQNILDDNIVTYENAINNIDMFSENLYFRYHKKFKNKGHAINTANFNDKEFPEISMIRKRLKEGIELTKCEEILLKVIFKDEKQDINSHLENSKNIINDEIIRLKEVIERKLNKNNIESFNEYVFVTKNQKANQIAKKLKSKIKENHWYLGTTESNNKLLDCFNNSYRDRYIKENNLTLINASMGSGYNEFLNTLFFENILKGENNIFFECENQNTTLLKLRNIENTTNIKNSIIYLSYEDFLSMSKEEFYHHVKNKKNICIALCVEKSPESMCYKFFDKIYNLLSYICYDDNRKNTINVFFNSLNEILKNNKNYIIYRNILNLLEDHNNFKNCKLIGVVDYYYRKDHHKNISAINSFNKSISDFFIMKSFESYCIFDIIKENFGFKEINSNISNRIYRKNEIEFSERDLRNLKSGECIHFHKDMKTIEIVKIFYSDVCSYYCDYISIDKNQ